MRRAEAGIQVDKFYPPTNWLDNNNKQIDIRKNAENNSIVLLVGHSADFSKYSLLGLLVDTSSGTYDVYIDDVLVGSGITKNTQYDIDFSTINTSYGSATTPETLVLHKVVVKPTTSGATITRFHCARTTDVSTSQLQGVLWCHLELENSINLENMLGMGSLGSQTYKNAICFALTSRKNKINVPKLEVFRFASSLKYFTPLINSLGATSSLYFDFLSLSSIKRAIVDNFNIIGNCEYAFYQNDLIEQINLNTTIKGASCDYCFRYNKKLKMLPNFDYSNVTSLVDFLREATSLFPTKIDLTSAKSLKRATIIGGSTYPMRGLRGLKVSNEAPFSGSSPQIDVSYTGLDRDALVELFQSLPTVTGGQTLNCVACSGNNLTKVGSPTIDENGVASGFDGNNYFRCGELPVDKDVTIYTKFKISNNISSAQYIIGFGNYWGISIANNKARVSVRTKLIDETYTQVSIVLEHTIEINKVYSCKLIIKKGNYVFSLYNSNNELLEEKSILQDSSVAVGQTIFISRYGMANTSFTGEIYLEDTSIKADRNYLMKGYILDSDKAIATDKGWGLVLS